MIENYPSSLKKITIVCLLLLITLFVKAQSWSVFPSGMNDWVYASVVYNGQLIVGGKFTSAGGVAANRIAKWNGTTWEPLGSGVNGKVNALAVYNNKLYVGGEFTVAGGQNAEFIAIWNGTSWSNATGDMSSIVTSMVVYNSKLIVGGYFDDADGFLANNIAAWDGNNWSTLGSGCTGSQGQVMCLEVNNNMLYAGGFFTTAGGLSANHIAKWNGSAWSSVGSGISGIVYSLGTYNGNLIAGGLFTSAGGNSANHIASWNGSTWSALGTGMSGTFYQYVFALKTYNNELYAGGYFTHSNGIQTNGIARWNGTSWNEVNGGVSYPANVSGVHTLCLYNNALFVGGLFNSAGANSAGHAALWSMAPPLTISLSSQDATCQSSNNGSINATISGGVPPYSYFWSTGDTTLNINSLYEGSYTLYVMDAFNNYVDTTVYLNYINADPVVYITSSGSTYLCPGDSVTLDAGNYSSYMWSTNETTASIKAYGTGNFDVTVTDSNGCTGNSSMWVETDSIYCATYIITRSLIEGYYNNGSMPPVLMNQGVSGFGSTDLDFIDMELHDAYPPYNLFASASYLIDTSGLGYAYFPFTLPPSASYYLVLKYRNGVEIWSSTPMPLTTINSYDFALPGAVYGNNMVEVDPGLFAMYSGDLNHDGSVDVFDYLLLDLDIMNGSFGYNDTDLNGDGAVDAFDYLVMQDNISNGVGYITP